MARNENWWEVADAPDRRFDLEKPIVGRTWLLDTSDTYMPETDIEALMSAAPGEAIRTSKEHLLQETEWLYDIIENELNETERAVAEVCLMAGHSVRRAADILGMRKSTVADYKRRVTEKLQRIIKERTGHGSSQD